MIRQSLRHVNSFAQLPIEVGPAVFLSEVRAASSGVSNLAEWVREYVLPNRESMATGQRQPSHHRATYGMRFFDSWKVSSYVRRTFNPATDANGWLAKDSATLNSVSHWVSGQSKLWLMEPVLPGRPNLEQEVRDIGQQFNAYRYVLDRRKDESEMHASLVAYVLRGGSDEARTHAISALRDSDHQVVDVARDDVAERFTTNVRELALTGSAQGEF